MTWCCGRPALYFFGSSHKLLLCIGGLTSSRRGLGMASNSSMQVVCHSPLLSIGAALYDVELFSIVRWLIVAVGVCFHGIGTSNPQIVSWCTAAPVRHRPLFLW